MILFSAWLFLHNMSFKTVFQACHYEFKMEIMKILRFIKLQRRNYMSCKLQTWNLKCLAAKLNQEIIVLIDRVFLGCTLSPFQLRTILAILKLNNIGSLYFQLSYLKQYWQLTVPTIYRKYYWQPTASTIYLKQYWQFTVPFELP